mmetsp:Transcript_11249/g.21225  ORF Transcript_11249/g.21225 Transcript_11249/m.21225 type:complete len:219 (+) Transcript_11249:921-1577(+)
MMMCDTGGNVISELDISACERSELGFVVGIAGFGGYECIFGGSAMRFGSLECSFESVYFGEERSYYLMMSVVADVGIAVGCGVVVVFVVAVIVNNATIHRSPTHPILILPPNTIETPRTGKSSLAIHRVHTATIHPNEIVSTTVVVAIRTTTIAIHPHEIAPLVVTSADAYTYPIHAVSVYFGIVLGDCGLDDEFANIVIVIVIVIIVVVVLVNAGGG